ncbi:MAG: hypothetical protein PUE34_04300 [Clostridiaceae bacterium]|nr:hypothetical protein [Clostridiaceae bacterium]
MKKFIIFICCAALTVISLTVPVSAADYTADVKLYSTVDLLINTDTNAVIIDKNADKQVDPSGLTKIMTALVVLQNEKDLSRKVTVSGASLESLYGTGCVMSGLQDGEVISVHDLLCCMLIPGGNDAALVLANEYGKGIDGFVAKMNAAAKKLGCTKTTFTDPHGLEDTKQKSTANDLAKIASAALKYSVFQTIVASLTYELPQTNKNEARTLVSTNYMLNYGFPDYYYDYCRGIKTGASEAEGQSMISYATKNGYTYLAVALGGPYKDTDEDGDTENQAILDNVRMFEWAFENLSYEIVTKQQQFVTTIPVNYCWEMDNVRLVAKSEVLALVPEGNGSQSVSFEPIDMPESLDAPFKAGDTVCKAKIMFAGRQIGTVELVVAESANMSMLLYLKSAIKRMTASTVFKILIAVAVIFIGIYVTMYIRANRRRRKNRELKMFKYSETQDAKQNKRKK